MCFVFANILEEIFAGTEYFFARTLANIKYFYYICTRNPYSSLLLALVAGVGTIIADGTKYSVSGVEVK